MVCWSATTGLVWLVDEKRYESDLNTILIKVQVDVFLLKNERSSKETLKVFGGDGDEVSGFGGLSVFLQVVSSKYQDDPQKNTMILTRLSYKAFHIDPEPSVITPSYNRTPSCNLSSSLIFKPVLTHHCSCMSIEFVVLNIGRRYMDLKVHKITSDLLSPATTREMKVRMQQTMRLVCAAADGDVSPTVIWVRYKTSSTSIKTLFLHTPRHSLVSERLCIVFYPRNQGPHHLVRQFRGDRNALFVRISRSVTRRRRSTLGVKNRFYTLLFRFLIIAAISAIQAHP